MKKLLKHMYLPILALFLAVTSVSGMDECVVVPHRDIKSVDHKQLRSYILKGIMQDSKGGGIDEFDNFLDGLKNDTYDIKKKTVETLKKRSSDFDDLLNSYVKSVSLFYAAFNNLMGGDSSSSFPGLQGEEFVRSTRGAQSYPNHEPYFIAFQDLSNRFISIRSLCTGIQLNAPFEVIEGTKDTYLKVGLSKDHRGYVPFPFTNKSPCFPVSVPYGSPIFPQKQFTFCKGDLIRDSGIVINNHESCLKFLMQQGEKAQNPFTVERISLRIPYTDRSAFMLSLEEQFGDHLKSSSHFIPMPTTPEENDLLELLFLEDLVKEMQMSKPGSDVQGSLQQFLTWANPIEESVEEKVEADAEAERLIQSLQKKIEQLEGKLLSGFETHAQEEEPHLNEESSLQVSLPVVSEAKTSSAVSAKSVSNQEATKVKKKNNRNPKNGKSKQGQQKKEKSAAVQSSQGKASGSSKNKEARQLFEEVKQAGRVKFKHILGIMNKIRAKASDKVAFAKIASINTTGSHISFHMEEGSGMTLVKKHGKGDVSYPASVVNHFSTKLINAIFSSHLSQEK